MKGFQEEYIHLLNKAGIYRLSHGQYADSALHRLMMWEDTLVLQGTANASYKTALFERYTERDSLFVSTYRLLSEMEATHKKFQTVLLRINNHLDRFSRSSEDVYEYFGPSLRMGYDVQTTEDDFKELVSLQGYWRNNAIHLKALFAASPRP